MKRVIERYAMIATQALLKLVAGLVLIKMVSAAMPPSDFFHYGQLQTIFAIFATGANAFIGLEVVSAIARKEKPQETILKTAIFICLLYGLLVALVCSLIFFSEHQSFIPKKYNYIFPIIPVAVLAGAAMQLLSSYYNGLGKYRSMTTIAIIGQITALIISLILIHYFGKEGAFLGVCLGIAGSGLLFIPALFRAANGLLSWPDIPLAKRLIAYGLVSAAAVTLNYGSQIYVREIFSKEYSLNDAGLWFAATKTSDIYMGIINMMLASVLIPAYIKDNHAEMKKNFALILFGIVVLLAITQTASPTIINIIYGEKYIKASTILETYAFGDAIKIIYWMFALKLLAEKKMKLFGITELTGGATPFLLAPIFASRFSFEQTPYMHATHQCLSLAIVITIFWKNRCFRT